MLLPKLHVLFCFCSCLMLAHPFDCQGLNPDVHVKPPARVNKTRALMAALAFGQTKIPKGNGPYPVGCTDLMSKYTNKSTFLRLYYPSQDDRADTVWIPNKEYFFGLSKFLGTHWLMGNILSFLFGSMTTPASWDSPLRTGEKYPLIVFSHGLGAFRTIYSAIGNDLASYGFIVATVEHRDRSASATYYFDDQSAAEAGNKTWLYLRTLQPGEKESEKTIRNTQVRQRAKECSQALDVILSGRPVKNVLDLKFDMQQLKDSIDRNRIAVMGHSFGGATVIQALHDDRRFRCGIALDAWMMPLEEEVLSKFSQPLFFINSERFQYHDNIVKMEKCFLPGKERKMITIRDSVHQNFADFTFATGKIAGYIFTLKGKIDSNVAINLSNNASLAFLQKHLELKRDFNKWDDLIEGKDSRLIPGSNINTTDHHSILQNSTGREKQNLD
ncbi:platelet-activating factor acetylhydrolase [Molossus molossus]|uniref:Platelet-activating factor acetylhydrolase n=1 Tax=Molossus molossus TaxID=27622 RepID=A0A7J8GS81_MOLMO|nr:platelet-activating factor acetylhydrolase [Molossus molossus]XP_036104757.1 platelet-activating factor acetylhydrolase [Molossus molossus]XP_036104758.1 platelet-activating factor acetylhydrolase [Molossus molossus]XP_036104759.1 platelet-activating factor acetylhydrolase [Molossus molossus]KAF6462770.1 phospholipase A2 group VII [Molossus molossus]